MRKRERLLIYPTILLKIKAVRQIILTRQCSGLLAAREGEMTVPSELEFNPVIHLT